MKRIPSLPPVRRALVLAAGNGDRFLSASRGSKLLQPVFGRPLILRTLTTAMEAGISSFEIVLGYQADSLRAAIDASLPHADIHFSYNPEWRLENGLSVLAARDRLETSSFALLMGDHVFEADALSRLLHNPKQPDDSVLAIDTRPAPDHVVDEATKVELDGSRIVAIGKDLEPFDALDTGMFLCSPTLFDALVESQRQGDTTLSGGTRQLAAQGLMHGLDVGGAEWYDIDTMEDLEAAALRLSSPPGSA